MRRTGKAIGTLAAATSLALVGSGLAFADTINDSINGNQSVLVVPSGGTATATTGSASIDINAQGGDGDSGCNIDSGEKLTLTLTAPAGVTVSPSVLEFRACGNAGAQSVSITAAAGATEGAIAASFPLAPNTTNVSSETGGSYVNNVNIPVKLDNDGDGVANGSDNCVNVANATQTDTDGDGLGDACDSTPSGAVPVVDTDGDTVPDSSDNCPNAENTSQTDSDGDGIGNACDSNAFAPVVGMQAGAANGSEGTTGNPTTTGSFTDADGNGTLAINKVANADGTPSAGTVVDNEDGTFSWSHTTTDDDSGSVSVSASDGEHTAVTQTFTWTASNVAPVITSVTQTRSGACAVALAANYTDAGSADSHDVTVLWNDDSTSLARSFTTAGTYSAIVTVTDDDGGADAEGVTDVRAYNRPSAVMAPINTSGTRSSFKIGSTIPVKITVMGCDGNQVTTLSPAVHLEQNDTTADVALNETSITEVATNGKSMGWSTDKYIYNLSSKASQFHNGTALTTGTYTVSANHATFEKPVKAAFDARK